MTAFLVLLWLAAAFTALDYGPTQLAHFHVGIVFGVVIAWWRWRRKPHP